jgi:hypothetical protein
MTKKLQSKAPINPSEVSTDVLAFALNYCKTQLSETEILDIERLFEALRSGNEVLAHSIMWKHLPHVNLLPGTRIGNTVISVMESRGTKPSAVGTKYRDPIAPKGA